MKACQAAVGIIIAMSVLRGVRLNGQSLVGDADQRPGPGRNGVHLYDVTAGVGYSSLVATPSIGENLAGLGGQGYATGSASLGYSHESARTSFELLYIPSYVSNFGFAEFTSFNQSFRFSLDRHINTRWMFLLSASAEDSTIDQILFNQTAASVTSLAGDSGKLVDPGALVPGATASPQTLLYGARVLMVSGVAGLTYRPSIRLRTFLGTNITQSQGLDNTKKSSVQSLFPSTTSEQGIGTISYSVNPRTEVGGDATFMNVHSLLGNYQATTLMGRYSRKLNQHWSLSLGAGGSVFTLQGQKLAPEPKAVTLATDERVHYDRRSHHISFSYSRTTGDSYGLASSATDTWLGAWSWTRPGRNWSLNASGGLQRFATGPLGTVHFWQFNSAVSRTLGRQTVMALSYAYLKEMLGPTFGVPDQGINSVRLTLSWVPLLRELQVRANGPARD